MCFLIKCRPSVVMTSSAASSSEVVRPRIFYGRRENFKSCRVMNERRNERRHSKAVPTKASSPFLAFNYCSICSWAVFPTRRLFGCQWQLLRRFEVSSFSLSLWSNMKRSSHRLRNSWVWLFAVIIFSLFGGELVIDFSTLHNRLRKTEIEVRENVN